MTKHTPLHKGGTHTYDCLNDDNSSHCDCEKQASQTAKAKLTPEQRERITDGHTIECATTDGRGCYCAAKAKPEHTPTPWTVGQKGSTLHIESPKAGYTVALIESCTDLVYSQDEANAAFIVRAVNSHADLLKALDKSAESIEQLCAMVNSYSTKLGLGKKVNAHDWIDLAMGRAIAKAEQV